MLEVEPTSQRSQRGHAATGSDQNINETVAGTTHDHICNSVRWGAQPVRAY